MATEFFRCHSFFCQSALTIWTIGINYANCFAIFVSEIGLLI